MTNYLSSRTQYVVLGNTKSRMKPILCSVPQGSVIGPLMYAVFINDLPETVKRLSCEDDSHQDRSTLFSPQCSQCGVLTIYADDLTYTVGSRTWQSNQTSILRSLDEIKLYLNDNGLVLNLPKTSLTEVMIAEKRAKTTGSAPTLTVTNDLGQDKVINNSNFTRILRTNIQNNMSWKAHLESEKKELLPQCRSLLGLLRHRSNLIPRSARRNLVNGLLLSKLRYLMPLWGSVSESLLNKAQILLNTAARWITGLGRKTKIRTLMEAAGWTTIREQVRLSIAV